MMTPLPLVVYPSLNLESSDIKAPDAKLVSPPIIVAIEGQSLTLLSLPTELILEACSYLSHPVDILSLARSNRRLNCLILPSSQIFRKCRERFRILEISRYYTISSREEYVWRPFPIPDPLEGQQEWELAVVLFGAQRCCVCCRDFQDISRVVGYGKIVCRNCHIGDIIIRDITMGLITYRKKATIARQDAKVDFLSRFGTHGSSWGRLHLFNSDTEDFGSRIADLSESHFIALWNSLPRIKDDHGYHYTFAYLAEKAFLGEWNSLRDRYGGMSKEERKEFVPARIGMHRLVDRRSKQARAINCWLDKYHRYRGCLRKAIMANGQNLARTHSLPFYDVQEAHAYRRLVSLMIKAREIDAEKLMDPVMKEAILLESRQINKNRINRYSSHAMLTRCSNIAALYNSYRFTDNVKPSLSVFKEIPILQALRKSYTPPGMGNVANDQNRCRVVGGELVSDKISIEEILREKQNMELVGVGVAKWKEGAVKGARRLLGYGESGKKQQRRRRRKKGRVNEQEGTGVDPFSITNANHDPTSTKVDFTAITKPTLSPWYPQPSKLNPEFRVTALFTCKKCKTLEAKYKRSRVLDFRGLCAHQCTMKDRSKNDVPKWSIENFALAEKPIAVVREMLRILGLYEEDETTTTQSLDKAWVCEDCTVFIRTLGWEDLVRHSLRHPTPHISLASAEEAEARALLLDARKAPLSFSDLCSGQFIEEEKREQFGCVHCYFPTSMRACGERSGERKNKVFWFGGMRQHMKAKHGIEDVRNEDFYFVKEELLLAKFSESDPMQIYDAESTK